MATVKLNLHWAAQISHESALYTASKKSSFLPSRFVLNRLPCSFAITKGITVVFFASAY
jgi:hypothetical protein